MPCTCANKDNIYSSFHVSTVLRQASEAKLVNMHNCIYIFQLLTAPTSNNGDINDLKHSYIDNDRTLLRQASV